VQGSRVSKKKHINQNTMKLCEQKNTKIVAKIKMQRIEQAKNTLQKLSMLEKMKG
jgi:acetylglutamate kinase